MNENARELWVGCQRIMGKYQRMNENAKSPPTVRGEVRRTEEYLIFVVKII